MTAVPAALDALVSGFSAAPALDGVLVFDGPWLRRPADPDVVVVGWTPDEGRTVEYVDAVAGLGSSRETFDVGGLASAWRGAASMSAVRRRADELIEAMRAHLRADPTLGGVVTRARLATLAFDEYQADAGTQVAVEFAIRIDAFRA
jgi:hypothetical protein